MHRRGIVATCWTRVRDSTFGLILESTSPPGGAARRTIVPLIATTGAARRGPGSWRGGPKPAAPPRPDTPRCRPSTTARAAITSPTTPAASPTRTTQSGTPPALNVRPLRGRVRIRIRETTLRGQFRVSGAHCADTVHGSCSPIPPVTRAGPESRPVTRPQSGFTRAPSAVWRPSPVWRPSALSTRRSRDDVLSGERPASAPTSVGLSIAGSCTAAHR